MRAPSDRKKAFHLALCKQKKKIFLLLLEELLIQFSDEKLHLYLEFAECGMTMANCKRKHHHLQNLFIFLTPPTNSTTSNALQKNMSNYSIICFNLVEMAFDLVEKISFLSKEFRLN
ncbi:CLUMA_CG016799, isoform A [Clunio marinus]|uniref:CLUMA_CG016799, isoform A n=1 Tax=Clunio marinus TaxID=568069 RepID=A0A1J1IW61_9DIPT|nr:CLUMA_CG016799, isoform A [Clunio marinus]